MRPWRACIAIMLTLSATSPSIAQINWSPKTKQALELIRQKDYQDALRVSEEAVAESPHDPAARAVRGQAYMYVGEYDLAIADHDAVLKVEANDSNALKNACYVRAVADVQLDLALTYCDRAANNGRAGDYGAYDTRGFLRIKRGEFAQAVADYDRALRLDEKLPTSLFGRGIAKLRLGKEADGRADMDEATKLDPSIAYDFARNGMKP